MTRRVAQSRKLTIGAEHESAICLQASYYSFFDSLSRNFALGYVQWDRVDLLTANAVFIDKLAGAGDYSSLLIQRQNPALLGQ